MIYFAQFSVNDGEFSEADEYSAHFPDHERRDIPRSDLYVLVEPALSGSEEFCRQLLEAMGQLFHQSKNSLTGGILRAMQAAHFQLRDWNRRSFREHRVAAGISALAVTDGEAYLGQVGPALAFARSNGAVSRLEPNIPEAMSPLGTDDEFWPAFSRIGFVSGDTVLLFSSNVGELLGESAVREALRYEPDQALPQVYRHVRELSDCSAVIVAAGDDEEEDEEPEE
ncbi:MAG TPA: hypothetical protein VFB90_04680 [Dehalococcoidia bacterium]|nr:hypothetical protein [Dehalococcoidia bacterium]